LQTKTVQVKHLHNIHDGAGSQLSQHTAFCFQVQALLQDPQGYLGGPGVNCKTVSQNKNIKENKEAPDKSWSVTIANQDTHKSSISTTSMMVLTRKIKTIKYDRLVLT
jgi:hypothetical protein